MFKSVSTTLLVFLASVSRPVFAMNVPDVVVTTATGIGGMSLRVPNTPPTLEETQLIVDQILELGKSRLAYIVDTMRQFNEDSALSSRLAINARTRKANSPELRAALQDLQTRYSTNEIEVIRGLIRTNLENFTTEAVERRQTEHEKLRFFLGRYPGYPEMRVLPVFKFLLSLRLEAQRSIEMHVTRGSVASTRPEDYASLNTNQKFGVNYMVDGMATYDQQLILLYDLLPPGSIEELRPFLTIPSLYVYLQGFEEIMPSRRGFPGAFSPLAPEVISSGSAILRYGLLPLSPCISTHLDTLSVLVDRLYLLRTLRFRQEFETALLPTEILDTPTPSETLRKKKKKKKKAKAITSQGTEVSSNDTPIVPTGTSEETTQRKEDNATQEESESETEEVQEHGSETLPNPLEGSHSPELATDEVSSKFDKLDIFSSSKPSDKASIQGPSAKTQRALRIEKMIAANSATALTKKDKFERNFSPLQMIHLEGDAAQAYKTLFKIGETATGPLHWDQFQTLFSTAIHGKILKHRGNGASRTLLLKVLRQDGSKTAITRYIHEPHASHGSTFGYEAINLLRQHFEIWGLAPGQGNVVLE